MNGRPFAFEVPLRDVVTIATGVNDGEALALIRAVYHHNAQRYRLVLAGSVVVVAMGIALVWYLGFHSGGLVPDEMGLMVVMMLAGATIGSVVALLYFGIIRHHRMAVVRCIFIPICFECGYNLGGLEQQATDGVIRVLCPECQTASPAARSLHVNHSRPESSLATRGRVPQPLLTDASIRERLSDSARRIIVLASLHARRFRHGYIGTEHLLLGLLGDQESAAGNALRDLGVDLVALQRKIESMTGIGAQVTRGRMAATPRARMAMERAAEEACALEHQFIGAEHVLLGLLREPEGLAAELLHSQHISTERLCETIYAALGAGPQLDLTSPPPANPPPGDQRT